MDAAAFWKVIGEYNLNTGVYQIALLALLIIGVLVSYFTRFKWIAKVVPGMLNLFVAHSAHPLGAYRSKSTHLQRIRRCHTSSCRYIWRMVDNK